MKKYLKILLALILLSIIGIFYYKISNTSKKNKTVNIGIILPLSGEAAGYGKSAKMGIELAYKDLKSVDSLNHNYKLFFEDSEGKPQKAISAFEKLKSNDNIQTLIGPISSPEVIALAPIVEKNKIVLLSPGASAPIISTLGDYIFRNVPSDVYEPTEMAKYVTNVLHKKNIAIMYVNNDYGKGVEKVFTNAVKNNNGNIVIKITYDRNSNDFKSQLYKIKEKNPDAIYFVGYKELGLILKQANELEIKSQFLSNSLFEDPEILKVAGKGAENVIFTTFPFDIKSNKPAMKKFVSEFKKEYNIEPDGFAAVAYEALLLIDNAIKLSGNATSEGIKNGLYKIKDYDGIIGKISFDKNGDVVFPITLKTVKNNKFINIKN